MNEDPNVSQIIICCGLKVISEEASQSKISLSVGRETLNYKLLLQLISC